MVDLSGSGDGDLLLKLPVARDKNEEKITNMSENNRF
jgi:hypothetical protein